MNEARMNGIMDVIRYTPASLREISTFTNIPSPVVEEYINTLLAKGMAKITHTRKLKVINIVYYMLTDKTLRYDKKV